MPDCSTLIAYSSDLAAYDFGPRHPLKPERFVLTHDLIEAYGLLDRPNVSLRPARLAAERELRLVHSPDYIDAVIRAGEGQPGNWWQYGLGPGDNPIFLGMHTAASRVSGATLVAAQAVLEGEAEHAFSPAGGLHHAMAERASGFCIYDDPAIAIAWLLEQGVERVAYVDLDVHHGDGVQAAFYNDPRVLTISVHESGRYLFPGTGAISELGGADARGTSVNVPLPPEIRDEAWLMAVRDVVPPLVRAWAPAILVTQLGCDTHATDPLAHLSLSTRAYREAATLLHELAHEAAGGRWLATGGGGYQWANVVPRAWTLYFAEMCGARLDDRLPAGFIERADALAGSPIPRTLSEEPDVAPGTDEPQAILGVVDEVKRTVFPTHGLEP